MISYVYRSFRENLVEKDSSRNSGSEWELYIVYFQSHSIDVYDTTKHVFQRSISVAGLGGARDIAVCEDVIYVSGWKDKLIHRNQLPEESVSNWKVDCNLMKLSTTPRRNVIVSCCCCCCPLRIIEYTSIGTLVREIRMNKIYKNVHRLHHAHQLDGDRFLIIHEIRDGIMIHLVSIIDSDGRLLKSYGREPGCGTGQMNCPTYLAIDKHGFILVADMDNDRVIQLNSSLGFVKEFIPQSAGLSQPLLLQLDEETGRLYVSENEDKCVSIFDL